MLQHSYLGRVVVLRVQIVVLVVLVCSAPMGNLVHVVSRGCRLVQVLWAWVVLRVWGVGVVHADRRQRPWGRPVCLLTFCQVSLHSARTARGPQGPMGQPPGR